MAKKEQGVIFKSSIGGYSKKAVNSYIQSENKKFMALEEDYLEKIEKMQRDLDATIAIADEYCAKSQALTEELDCAKAELSQISDKLLKSENAVSEIKVSVEEKDSTIAELTAALEKSTAERELSSQRVFDLERINGELSRALDEMTEKVTSLESSKGVSGGRCADGTDEDRIIAEALLNRARSASEDILKRAELGAEVILDRARKEALDYRLEIFDAAKDVFASATEELRRSIGICMSDFARGIKTANGDPVRAVAKVALCDDDLARRIEMMQSDLDRAISDKLAEFDAKHGDGK